MSQLIARQVDDELTAIVKGSYEAKFYEQLAYGDRPKMETFSRWRHILTPAQRVAELERALDYELWLEVRK